MSHFVFFQFPRVKVAVESVEGTVDPMTAWDRVKGKTLDELFGAMLHAVQADVVQSMTLASTPAEAPAEAPAEESADPVQDPTKPCET